MRVLVVEDEPKMAGLLHRGLVEEGYAVDVATNGTDGYAAAVSCDYDAVVLDAMLPGLSGFDVCRRLRQDKVWVPVLMLTARAAVSDRICGLDGGADDYLTKPFHLAELFARLRALTRRGPVAHPTVLTAGNLRLDPASRRCWRDTVEIVLTGKEYALLETFLRHPGVVLSRDALVEHCWDFAHEPRSNIIDAHIHSLRDKIDRQFQINSLETIRGAGYRIRADGGHPT